MPSYNKNGRGFTQKRGRSRALTPERPLRRRPRDEPPPKRRAVRSRKRHSHSERSRRGDHIDERVGSPSTSSGGRTTRNSRGLKRKDLVEPSDEENEQPPKKRLHVETENKSPQETGKSSKKNSKQRSTSAKDGEENEDDRKSINLEEKKEEGDREKDAGKEKRKKVDEKNENQKKDEDKKDKSEATEDDKEEEEEEEKNDKGEGKSKDKDDHDDDDEHGTTTEGQSGGSSSTEIKSTEGSKSENSQAASKSENSGKGKERERSSCMGCCDSREEDEWHYRSHLRLPPKDTREGMTIPSGMLAGVGLTNWDLVMPLPMHQENDEWTTESLMELFANPGCVSPPLPPQISDSGLLDLEKLLDLYDVDMPQDYHTSITGNEDGV